MESRSDHIEKNSVKYLQIKSFTSMSLQEQLEIKHLGRPTPELNISQSSSSRNHSFMRRFNSEIYYKHRWLCGCAEKNALFCFPCLLYGGETTWTQTGTTDLKHLGEKIKKHEMSMKHLRNVMNFGMLGNTDLVTFQLSEGYRQEIKEQNENVKKNREILSKIIDCIKFIGKFELSLVGYKEDIIKGLIEFAGKLDGSLRNHFMNSSTFKEILINDILECMCEVCQEEIRNEIVQSNSLAVISEGCSSLSEKVDQMILFRYVLKGRVHERFWGLFKLKSQCSESLAECIKSQLNIVLEGETEKLIAQSYDGSAMIMGLETDVHHIIRRTYPHALLVHHYAHKFSSIVEKVASQNQRIQSFFFDLNSVVNFFTESDTRSAALESISKRFHQEVNLTSNRQESLANKVFESRHVIKECLETLKQTSSDMDTVQKSTALVHILNDEDFNFWLEFFNDIMPLADILDNQLYSNNFKELNVIRNSLEEFSGILQSERNRLLSAMPEEIIPNPVKKRKLTIENTAAAKEITDNIICQAEERFSFIKYMAVEKLFDSSLFNVSASRRPFPVGEVEDTIEAYPFLYKERLVTELSVLYERPEFIDIKGVLKMFDILYNTGISEYFIDVTKLMNIILTIPIITSETERYFRTSEKVKLFLKKNKSQENLVTMAMLSLEHVMIEKMVNFNDRVIDKFANREGRSLHFKYQ